MSLKIDYAELKLESLVEAISYPPLKKSKAKDVPTVEVSEFRYDLISEKIKANDTLSNTEGAHIEMILEMIQLLADNKTKFKIDLHNYIGFYWRGLPILVINIVNDNLTEQSTMMYISVKVYKDELKEQVTDKKIQRGVVVGIGGLILFGGLFGIVSLFRRRD